MGIDFGKKRVGVAVGNRISRNATPCRSIVARGDARLQAIADLLREWEPQALVLGIPYHPDGAAHTNTRSATTFGRQLAERCRLPVFGVDERYSTTEALALGASDPDAAAACIILEQFLNALP
ncbi:MAG: Holliday junction resolvase RuvX [Brachymonas sp.]|nr:Holliday junction resolvase RuvX [Brachymonas sp.]